MTIKIARAIAQDIGDGSIKRRGLSAWDEEAWDAAANMFGQLVKQFGFDRDLRDTPSGAAER